MNPRFAPSVSDILRTWDTRSQLRYHALSDRAWKKTELTARPLSRPWHGKLPPSLAISPTSLIVAAGSKLYSYIFTPSASHRGSPGIQYGATYIWGEHLGGRNDVKCVVFAPDSDRTLYIGFGDGTLERVTLPELEPGPPQTIEILDAHKTVHYLHGNDAVQGLASRGDLLLSVSLEGTAVLSNFHDPENPSSHTIELQERSWSLYLAPTGTSKVAFGSASQTPLTVHDITNSELSPTPSAILTTTDGIQQNRKPSAVYGICGAPPSAQYGSEQVIVSGWYDGSVRVHDLRSSKRAIPFPGSSSPAPLLPVMSFHDPWSFEPIYSVATGGGSCNHIAAGSARHSVVAFWDVRFPTRGWSVHAPGNDVSPVYSIVLESTRLFGATQSRPFVYDFGSGVDRDTFPNVRFNARDGLRQDGVGFYVTKYKHSRKY